MEKIIYYAFNKLRLNCLKILQMSCPIGKEEIEKLRFFISVVSQNPAILHLPELSFFKSFIEQLGGQVPNVRQGEK